MRVVVGITGASGAVIGIRLVEELRARKAEVHAVVTAGAREVIRQEVGRLRFPKGVREHGERDTDSPLYSSSFGADAMVVAPCSMKTLSAMANDYEENLVVRAALAMLRTGRRLVVVPRETPLSLAALENMSALRRDGAVILPAMVAYYHGPKTADDMTDFLVGKILDVLGVEHGLYRRWDGGR